MKFNLKRTIDAAAYFLRREPDRRMSCARLLALLYIAERDLLRESALLLTASRVRRTERGPVLDSVCELLQCQHYRTAEWSKHFFVNHYWVQMTCDPGNGELSRHICSTLERIARECEYHDDWNLFKVLWSLPEAQVEGEVISVEELIDAVGRTEDKERIVSELQYHDEMDKLFREPAAK